MPLDLERPAFDGSLSFPEQFLITMDVLSIDIVFRCVIAEQAQIKKIRSQRQEFEGCKISFVKRGGIGPRPANMIFFQKMDELRSVPSRVPKFNRETEIARQFAEKLAQNRLALLWCKGRRKLDEDDLEF